LSSVEKAQAAVHLLWLRLRLPRLLATRPLDALLRGLTQSPPWYRVSSSFQALEGALDQAERVAERIPRLPRTCLYRCLARYAVFRRHGFPAEFVMAVSPRGPDEDGHAWLEFDGVPYREDRAAEFVVSFRYPARAGA
jgi:Transglutaminase-like superfamily